MNEGNKVHLNKPHEDVGDEHKIPCSDEGCRMRHRNDVVDPDPGTYDSVVWYDMKGRGKDMTSGG